MKPLSEKQIERYLHHIAIKDVGGEGQKKLLSAKVLIVGVGGLGSPAALYLAAAGIGTLGLIDDDKVELSNLQRQIVHGLGDIGSPKVLSAKKRLSSINDDVKIIPYYEKLTEKNAKKIFADFDFIIDGSDNFPTKFLINDTAVALKKSFSHGGVVALTGQTFTYSPGHLCYRCIFNETPEPNPSFTCRGAGILGPVAGVIGSIQAMEAMKFILGKGELLHDRLLTFNALNMEFRSIKIKKNKNCPVCG